MTFFWGTLGQSRNYTIEYKLKENVTMAEFAKAMNDYIAEKNERVLFDHWMEADYLDTAGSKGGRGTAASAVGKLLFECLFGYQ